MTPSEFVTAIEDVIERAHHSDLLIGTLIKCYEDVHEVLLIAANDSDRAEIEL